METQTQRTDLWTWAKKREGEGGTSGEEHGTIYTAVCKIQTVSGNLLYDSGNSDQGSVTTERGGKGGVVGRRLKRERTLVYLQLTHVDT